MPRTVHASLTALSASFGATTLVLFLFVIPGRQPWYKSAPSGAMAVAAPPRKRLDGQGALVEATRTGDLRLDAGLTGGTQTALGALDVAL